MSITPNAMINAKINAVRSSRRSLMKIDRLVPRSNFGASMVFLLLNKFFDEKQHNNQGANGLQGSNYAADDQRCTTCLFECLAGNLHA